LVLPLIIWLSQAAAVVQMLAQAAELAVCVQQLLLRAVVEY
jgi:hypothetical protein